MRRARVASRVSIRPTAMHAAARHCRTLVMCSGVGLESGGERRAAAHGVQKFGPRRLLTAAAAAKGNGTATERATSTDQFKLPV